MVDARQRTPDRRVVRSRRAILRAALDELADAGYAGFTMDAVAQRAGVGRSTLYRHWNDRAVLVADALEELNVQPGAPPEAPDPRLRVELLLGHLCEALAESPVGKCLPALVHAAEREEALGDFLHSYSARRRRALTEAIAGAVAAGTVRPVDPEEASAALSGAVFYRRLMTSTPMSRADVSPLVEAVLGPGPTEERKHH